MTVCKQRFEHSLSGYVRYTSSHYYYLFIIIIIIYYYYYLLLLLSFQMHIFNYHKISPV